MSIDELNMSEIGMLQLSDSFFPTGMYATSSGLEAMYYAKKIKNVEDLRKVLEVYIGQQIGPADCNALSNAHEFAARSDLERLVEVDQTIYAMKLCREIRSASTRSGIQLLRCLKYFIKDNEILNQYLLEAVEKGKAPGMYPVALGVASCVFGIPKTKAVVMMLYSYTLSVIGAAVRLGVVSHFDGQKVIHELKSLILETAKQNIDRPLSSIWQFAAEIDVFQMVHEQMSSRMFIS